MVDLIQKITTKESLWYPSCGSDYRPVTHVAFNNLFVDPSVLIFNDIDETIDFSEIPQLKGSTLISSNEREDFDVKYKIYLFNIETEKRIRIKELIFFPISNQEMFKFLLRYGISPKTILFHNLKDEQCTLQASWWDTIRILKIKYVYTDNWYLISLNTEDTFRNTLQKKGVRYISKQSYTGFILSKNLNKTIKLAMNNCFESMLHLFEIPPSKISNSIN